MIRSIASALIAVLLAVPAAAQSVSAWGGGQPAGTVVAAPPAGLGHVPPFVVTRRPDGTYRHTFDVTTRRPTPTVTIYVGPGGDNAAACTSWATRCRSLYQGLVRGKAQGAAATTLLYAQVGQYLATNVDGSGIPDDLGGASATYGRNLVIEPVDASGNPLPQSDGRYSLTSQIVSVHNIGLPTFSATSDATVWVGTYTTQTPAQAAWDTSKTNAYGRPLGITNLPLSAVPDVSNPIAQLNALHATFGKGAYFLDTVNKKIWIRLSDGRAPDANVFVSKTGDSLYLAPGGGVQQVVYLRNVDVWGGFIRSYASKTASYGAGQTIAVTTSDSYVGYVGVNNIAFNWQHSGSAVHLRDVATDTYLDAFAYQVAGDDVGAGAGLTWYELDSIAEYVGNDTINDSSTNASTTHRATIGVRVNDRYAYVSNRIIHDIQDARTWSTGITAGPSTRASQAASGYTVALADRALKSSVAVAAGYYDNTGTPESSRVWIDGLSILGPVTFGLGAYNNPGDGGPGGTIYYRNVTAADAATRTTASPYAGQAQSGTIQPY